MANIALLGHGVVGSGVAEIILNNIEKFKKETGEEVNLKYILDLRDFSNLSYGNLFTKDFNDILNDESVSVVVEVIGGINPAFDFVASALKKGKSVVTSNKELVAKKGHELYAFAKENNCNFMFEASVGGGIPIIRPLNTCLAANDIDSIVGILNGTTNYILTKMANDNASFDSALKEAQELGYAERNPAADVEGLDACRKICILSNIITGKMTDTEDVYVEGICNLTPAHSAMAKIYGGAVKLIGQALKEDNKVYVCVRPFVVADSNPLSHVDDVFNGILADGNYLGQVAFIGKGAGKLPTASAVVADVLDCVKSKGRKYNVLWDDTKLNIASQDELKRSWLVKTGSVNIENISEKAFGEGIYETKPVTENELLALLGGEKAELILPILK